jgi:hypothetical protein
MLPTRMSPSRMYNQRMRDKILERNERSRKMRQMSARESYVRYRRMPELRPLVLYRPPLFQSLMQSMFMFMAPQPSRKRGRSDEIMYDSDEMYVSKRR